MWWKIKSLNRFHQFHHPQWLNDNSKISILTQGRFCWVVLGGASPTRCPHLPEPHSPPQRFAVLGLRWSAALGGEPIAPQKFVQLVVVQKWWCTNALLWNCIHTTSFNFDSFCMITGVTSNSSCIWCTGTSTTSQKGFMKRSCQQLAMENVRPDSKMPGKDGPCNTNCCVLQWRT